MNSTKWALTLLLGVSAAACSAPVESDDQSSDSEQDFNLFPSNVAKTVLQNNVTTVGTELPDTPTKIFVGSIVGGSGKCAYRILPAAAPLPGSAEKKATYPVLQYANRPLTNGAFSQRDFIYGHYSNEFKDGKAKNTIVYSSGKATTTVTFKKSDNNGRYAITMIDREGDEPQLNGACSFVNGSFAEVANP